MDNLIIIALIIYLIHRFNQSLRNDKEFQNRKQELKQKREMKTLTNIGTFGMIVIPIAFTILSIGAYFVAQVIINNLTIY